MSPDLSSRRSDSTPPEPQGAPCLSIPDHKLIRHIGQGSYGEVWLAESALGTLRAVKVVFRRTFTHERPYEREFSGIKKFEPISRSHEGLVDILQVGRNDDAGYFYYVMELADALNGVAESRSPECGRDQLQTTNENLGSYKPRTLANEVSNLDCLPVERCVQIGLALTSALTYLHKQGLIHRDIKPSNIIFVNDVPKLADIGTVAQVSDAQSYVGTEGFTPRQGSNSAQSDLYSLGKVLYEISTGKDRHDYPELPTNLEETASGGELIHLNEIIIKACRADPKRRYASAEEMHADLLALHKRKSPEGSQRIKRRIFYMVGTAVATLALCGVWLRHWHAVPKQTAFSAVPAGPRLMPSAQTPAQAPDSAQLAKLHKLLPLVDAWERSANLPRTIGEISLALKRDPRNPLLLSAWGASRQQLGLFDEAYAAFVQAIEYTDNESIVWRFETRQRVREWIYHDITNATVAGAHLVFNVGGGDPYIYRTGISFSGSLFPSIRVRMRNATAASKARIYWGMVGSGGTRETQHIDFRIKPNDAEMTTYDLDLSNHLNWKNHVIDLLRLTPAVAPKMGKIELESIAVQVNSNRLSQTAPQPDSILRKIARDRTLLRLADLLGRQQRAPEALPYFVPARQSNCPPTLIDLSAHYNAGLRGIVSQPMFSRIVNAQVFDQVFDQVQFDARACVQLNGGEIAKFGWTYPSKAIGIPVARSCQRLHFLHGARWKAVEGTEIARFLVRNSSGVQVIPLIYGQDVRDYYVSSDPLPVSKSVEVSLGADDKGGPLRVFHTTWLNPEPASEIAAIDFVSNNKESSPFLLGITAE